MRMHEQAETGVAALVAGLRASVAEFLRRYPLGAAGAAIMLGIVLMAVFANWITAFDPTATNSHAALARPGGEHLLGADFMGRDMWSRIVFGARISLAVGIGSTGLGCIIGVIIGLLSGYFGGGQTTARVAFKYLLGAAEMANETALIQYAAFGPAADRACAAVAARRSFCGVRTRIDHA